MADNDWRDCFVLFWPKTLTNGSKAAGRLMRRKTPSGWEYRKPTPDEDAEYVSSEAW